MGGKALVVKNEWILKNKFHCPMELLGKGATGRVYKTFREDDRKRNPLAIKISSTDNKEDYEDLVKEISNMTKVKGHPNIVSIFSSNSYQKTDPDDGAIKYYVQIAMECADQSLEDIIKTRKQIPIQEVFKIAFDSLTALKHLSTLKMGHLDLKPPNILFFQSQNLYKLSDWTGALQSRQDQTLTAFSSRPMIISPYYSSPELLIIYEKGLNAQKFDFIAADVYSLGITLVECLGIKKDLSRKEVLVRPPSCLNNSRLISLFIKEWKSETEAHTDFIQDQLLQQLDGLDNIDADFLIIIQKILRFNPKERCTIEEALKFFQDKIKKIEKIRKEEKSTRSSIQVEPKHLFD